MEDLIRQFGIDARILLAQIINFLVLLFLLRRFAYRPLLRMMQKRREEIAKGVRFTADAEKRLFEINALKERTLRDAREEGIGIIKRSEQVGEVRKDELLEEANKKTESIVEAARKKIKEEEMQMKDNVLKSAEELVRLAVGRVLGKMPSEERDELLIKEAILEMRSRKNQP